MHGTWDSSGPRDCKSRYNMVSGSRANICDGDAKIILNNFSFNLLIHAI